MASSIRIGSFELSEIIGRGGMGDVWRGRHVVQDVDVAIKVITSSRIQNPRALAAFRNEVHAMARLDHPGIVMVFDVGEVPPDAAEASGGLLTAGSPALAMELATHGTLERVRDGLHYKRLRGVLLSILDALAHAHARGVIHRDLKPGNVLITDDGSGHPMLKLADFGLAQAMRGPGEDEPRKISGTPKYMAPEQIEGRWRDQGPWTDLYAFGCLTYWLVTGQPPWVGDVESVLAGHLFERHPALDSDIELPPGFDAWLAQLLAKSPAHRFRSAADAAFALMSMDGGPVADLDGFGEGLLDRAEAKWTAPELSVLDQTIVVHSDGSTRPEDPSSRPLEGYSATLPEAPAIEPAPAAVEPLLNSGQIAPIPADWRRTAVKGRSMKLIGAGLGLYGLRPVPLVDREHERETLWKALRDVHEHAEPRVVTLVGAAGSGKSRLAEWLGERAAEVGAADTLRAFHGFDSSAGDSLARMLGEFLRCHGLDHEATTERVRNAYFLGGAVDSRDLYDATALAELINPATNDAPDRVRFGSPAERHVVMARFLARQACQRPLVVWLDDVQWGLDSLEFVQNVLAQPGGPAILFVLTAREEALAEDSPQAQRLLEIADDPRAGVVEVAKLGAADHEVLVAELLGLEPGLAQQVAGRTAGNPLFAVQLVGDWVQRGILQVGDEGFLLAEGASAELPDSIHDVWTERVDGFLARVATSSGRRVLELAALIGQEVEEQEWAQCCEQLTGSRAPLELLDELVEEGLVVRRRGGFGFSHGMLQESLVRRATEEFRAAGGHGAIAAVLGRRPDAARPEVQERIGLHLKSAGAFDECLQPLLRAADVFGERSDYERSKHLVGVRETALDAMGAAPSDERRGDGWHVVVRCLLRQGLVQEAAVLIERGATAARKHGWSRLAPEFALHLASLARKRGDSERAMAQYDAARELFAAATNPLGVAKCTYGLGEVLLYRGDVVRATELLEEALDLMRRHATDQMGVVLIGLAYALIRSDRHEEARARLEEAIASFKLVANRGGRAAALNMLGELERARGELELAEAAYQEAVEVLGTIGSRGVTIPRLNLGLVYIAHEKWPEAFDELSTGAAELEVIGEKSHLGFVHLGLACACAGLARWMDYDFHLARAVELLEETAWVDADIAHHAELAAASCRAHGEEPRAVSADELAAVQRAALNGAR